MSISPGSVLPPDWVTEPARRTDGWSIVVQSSTALLLRASALATTAYGFYGAGVQRQRCNVIEIDSVCTYSFPYLRITGHPRDLRHENAQ